MVHRGVIGNMLDNLKDMLLSVFKHGLIVSNLLQRIRHETMEQYLTRYDLVFNEGILVLLFNLDKHVQDI